MARMRTTVSALVAGVLVAGVPAAMPLAAAPDVCAQDTVAAEDLPSQVSLDDCDLEGATITSAGLRVDVPPPGQGRSIVGLTTSGETTLEVSTSDDGVLTVSTKRLDAAPAEPEPAPYTAAQTGTNPRGSDSFAGATPLRIPNSFMPTVGQDSAWEQPTLEPGEPAAGCGIPVTGTLWYRVERPGSLQRVKVRSNAPVAVYRGTDLASLVRVGCVPPGDVERRLTLAPKVAHYLQVGIPVDGPSYVVTWLLNGEMRPDGPPPCDVRAHKLVEGAMARKPLQWRFHAASTPPSLTKTQALRGIKMGMNVIVGSVNDCGMPDRVSARHRYLGTTSKRASLCVGRGADGVNSVSFGPAPYGMVGLACSAWMVTSTGKRNVVESDMRLSSGVSWTMKPDAPTCQQNAQMDLVGVVAHEAGHVFGLDHAEGVKGLNQTMAPSSSACNGASRTLGRGDVVALRKLY
jgi:hypothetical protein